MIDDAPDAPQLTAPERVYRALRREILEGRLGPGDRLTSLGIAEQMGVSRTPVRSALIRLEADGLVENTGGQSARVRALTADEVEAAYDVAMGLEGMLVYRLAQTLDDGEADELLDAVAGMESAAASGDRQAWVEADRRFHALLVELSSNSLVGVMMDRVETVIGRLRFMSLHVNPRGAEQSAQDHRAVADAVRRGDAETARQRHHEHWERVRTANVHFLRESFGGGPGFLMGRTQSAPGPGKEG